MTLTLYFLRHAQTDYCVTGGYCGSSLNDPGLTPDGMEMAEAFARAYQSFEWQAILCSPLKRTIQTTKPICAATGMDMKLREELKEINYGQWEGKHPDVVNAEFHDDYVRWLTDPAWNAPTDGERAIDIARRCSRVIEEVEQTYTNGNILLVSHKATIRIILCELLGIDVGRYRDRFAMPVGGISIVELAARGPFIHVIGDRSYMSPYQRSLPST
ncbi:MAG: histidine phosphatase family protein [Leptolyngbyaceae cyanobacterium bins.59]|nr:histidine phosphatase family protein [Leptolyngbyaceae cyanobacterium bins.59]